MAADGNRRCGFSFRAYPIRCVPLSEPDQKLKQTISMGRKPVREKKKSFTFVKLCLLSFRKICLSQFYVHSIQTLSTFLKVVGYIVILADFVNQAGNMYKILLA